MHFNKGDIVEISSVQRPKYIKGHRHIVTYKLTNPIVGIVLGYSFLHEGYPKTSPYDYDTMSYFEETARVKVLVIEPLSSQRYLQPKKALEKDCKLILCSSLAAVAQH